MFYGNEPLALISCSKLGVLRHVGILLPSGLVAHCARHRGEHISTVEEFASGQDVSIDVLLPSAETAAILWRIAEAMRALRAYDDFTNNCEMFVNRMLGGPPVSPQLRAVVILAGLGLLARWAK